MVKYFNGFRNKYGITQSYKAFTLVELIVVITILAILGTISFVSMQNYMKDARDLKRIAEIKQLFTKIEIEHTKGVPYADLINVLDPDTDCHTGNILGQSNVIICQGPANFGVINENQDSFKDGGNDYIFAYTAPITVQGGDYGISTVSYYTRKWNK